MTETPAGAIRPVARQRLACAAALTVAVLLAGCTGPAPRPTDHAAPAEAPTPTRSPSPGVADAYWFTATTKLPQGADPKSDGWQISALPPQDPNGTGDSMRGSVHYVYDGPNNLGADLWIEGPYPVTEATLSATLADLLQQRPLTVQTPPAAVAGPGGASAIYVQGKADTTDLEPYVTQELVADGAGHYYVAFMKADAPSPTPLDPQFQTIVRSIHFESH